MSLLNPKLHLSEHFVSLQGEGKTIGTPSIFWRFKGCTFDCVWCDTTAVWKQGIAYTYEELYALFNNAGYFSRLNHHSHHLVITGGDPLLQQTRITEFLSFCQERGERVDEWFIECENHAYLMPEPDFAANIHLWNISPKLQNAGIAEEKRINPPVVDYYVNRCQAIFKFPIMHAADVFEVLAYQRRFAIKSGRIWLMPVCATRLEHETKGAEVAKLAIEYGMRFSPRLQLVLWDKTTGV